MMTWVYYCIASLDSILGSTVGSDPCKNNCVIMALVFLPVYCLL